MHSTGRSRKIMVSADGTGIVSQAGGLLLTQALRVTGLDRGLAQALEPWRAPRAVHSPGKILTDLVMALALGGDCLADLAMLHAQPELHPAHRQAPGGQASQQPRLTPAHPARPRRGAPRPVQYAGGRITR